MSNFLSLAPLLHKLDLQMDRHAQICTHIYSGDNELSNRKFTKHSGTAHRISLVYMPFRPLNIRATKQFCVKLQKALIIMPFSHSIPSFFSRSSSVHIYTQKYSIFSQRFSTEMYPKHHMQKHWMCGAEVSKLFCRSLFDQILMIYFTTAIWSFRHILSFAISFFPFYLRHYDEL